MRYPNASTEPLEIIRVNECEDYPNLATKRFQALWNEIERLQDALRDIQREAMAFKPPRHSWYYDRAQNALSNSNEPLQRDGLTLSRSP